MDSCRPLLTHALAWPRLTNHSLPPKWRWFVHHIISPGLPPLKKIAAEKHMFAKLPLVASFISNLTRLTAVVCMKVRFEAKVTRGFSLSPRRFRDSLSPLHGLLLISFAKKNHEKPLGPGYMDFSIPPEVVRVADGWHSRRLACLRTTQMPATRTASQMLRTKQETNFC